MQNPQIDRLNAEGLHFTNHYAGRTVCAPSRCAPMTGPHTGTGAMYATSCPPPTLLEPFAWMTDEATRRYRFDKFVEVMKTVMARREKEPGEAYVKRLEELHGKLGGS